MQNNKKVKAFSDGLKVSLNRENLKPSEWICENFQHPRNNRLPWSFKDHEFQIEIADDMSREICVKKAAQIGLSEISIRIALSFCSMNDYLKMAYILPTSRFASEFSATRFTPAIESSEHVSGIISKDVDNTGVKRIGTSFLLMRGTSGTVSAISVDLDFLLTDEVDFCNSTVLGSFASRLQHSELKLTRSFSTPTVPEYGISALYDDSSQGRYRVRHSKCGKWVAPDSMNDIVMPRFNAGFSEYRSKDYLQDKRVILDAYIKCPHCNKKIDWADFCEPDLRGWVHDFPDQDMKGFSVKPWDVPKYNPLDDVLKSITKYTLYSDYMNFRHGEDYSSAENSFLVEVIKRNQVLESWTLDGLALSGIKGIFIGADLGKTSYIMVGVHSSEGKLLVICAETVSIVDIIKVGGLGPYLARLFRTLNGSRMVVDAAPNYETALYLHGTLYQGQAYGAYYKGESTTQLDIYNFNDSKGVVTIDRTASFDDSCKAVNTGQILFPQNCSPDVVSHLKAMKKVKKLTAKGAMKYEWTNTGEDHFAHALNYMYCAWASIENRMVFNGIGAGIVIQKVKMKGLDDIDMGSLK